MLHGGFAGHNLYSSVGAVDFDGIGGVTAERDKTARAIGERNFYDAFALPVILVSNARRFDVRALHLDPQSIAKAIAALAVLVESKPAARPRACHMTWACVSVVLVMGVLRFELSHQVVGAHPTTTPG